MTFPTDSELADTLWACARKRGYPTEEIARLGVSAIVRSDPTAEVRAYACRRCGLWHIGATPPDERRRLLFPDDDDPSPLERVRRPHRRRRRSYG